MLVLCLGIIILTASGLDFQLRVKVLFGILQKIFRVRKGFLTK